MAITRATGFPVNNTTSATAPAATWVTVGDLAVLCIADGGPSPKSITAVSSSKTTGWMQVTDAVDATDGWSVCIWAGTITATGSDTITVTWSGSTPTGFEVVVDELSSGLGTATVWSLVTSGSLRRTAAPANYPSLTSGTAALQAYWGYQFYSGNQGGGTGTGFTFTATGFQDLIAFNGTLSTSTAYQPVGSATGNTTWAAAGIISAALPPASYVFDSFTGTNGTALSSHTPNTGAIWSSGPFSIASNAAAIPGNFLSQAYNIAGTAAGSADFDVSIDVLAVASSAGQDKIGVMGRGTFGAGNFYMAYYDAGYSGTASEVRLAKFISSGETILGTSAVITYTQGVTHNLKLRMSGSRISVLVDNVTVISVTDTQYTSGTQNGLIGATLVGVSLAADNYLVTDAFGVLQSGTSSAFAYTSSTGVTLGSPLTAGSKIIGISILNTWNSAGGWASPGGLYTKPSWAIPFDTTTGTSISAAIIADAPYAFVDGSTVPATSTTDPGKEGGRMTVWAGDTPSGLVGTTPTFHVGTDGTPGTTLVVLEVIGLPTGTTGLVDGTPGELTGVTGTAPGLASYAASSSGEMLFNLFGGFGNATNADAWTGPSGYTIYQPTATNPSSGGLIGTAVKSSTGSTETGTFTIGSNAVGWFSIVFAIAGGSATVHPTAIACLTVLPAPSITGNHGATVTPAAIACTTAMPAPTVSTPAGGGGPVTWDYATGQFVNITSGSAVNTWTHTCSGTSRLVVVCCTWDRSPDTGTTMSATYDGVAMTSIGMAETGSSGSGAGFVQGWYLINPPTGAKTVVVTATGGSLTGGMSGGSSSYNGVNQTTAVRNFAATSADGGGSGTNGISEVISSAIGNMVVAAACYGGSGTMTSGETLRMTGGSSNAGAGMIAIADASGAGSVTMDFATAGAIDWWGEIGFDVVAAPPAVTWNVLQTFNDPTGTGGVAHATPTNNLTPGSKLIAIVGGDTGSGWTVTSIGDGAGHNFSQLTTFRYSTSNREGVDIWVLDNTLATKPTFTTACSSAGNPGPVLVIMEVTGLATGTTTAACYDGSAATTSWSAHASPPPQPTYSSSVAGEFLLSVLGDIQYSLTTWVEPSGYTDGGGLQSGTYGTLLPAYKSSTGGSESAAWSWTGGGTEDGGAVLVAFKLAGGGATVTPAVIACTTTVPAPTVSTPAANPTLVQSVTKVWGSPTSPATQAFTSSVTAGNLLLVYAGTNSTLGGDPAGTTVTDSLGNTWNVSYVANGSGVAAGAQTYVFYAIANASGACTISLVRSGGGTFAGAGMFLQEWTNIASSPLDSTHNTVLDSAGSANVAPSFTGLAGTNDLVTYWCYHGTAINTATGSGWTDTAQGMLTSGGNSYYQVTYKLGGTSVTGPTIVPGTNDIAAINGVAFKAGISGGGGSATVTPVTISCITAVPTLAGSTSEIVVVSPVVATTQVPTPTVVTAQNANVTPTAIVCTTVVPTPTVSTAASATVTPTAIACLTTVPSPTISAGRTLTPVAVTCLTAVPAPQVNISETLSPTAIACLTVVPAPQINISKTVTPTAIVCITAVPSPTISTGAIVTPTAIACLTVVPAPQVNISKTLFPTAIVCITAVPAPQINISKTVAPSAIVCLTAVPAPSASAGSTASPTTVAAITVVPSPTESTGSTVSPIAVVATTQVPIPTVTAGANINLTPSSIACTTALPAPTIIVSGTAILTATTGMTVGATVTQLALVVLAGGASLNVGAIVTELATVSMSATAGLMTSAVVTEVASVSLSATAGMTVPATVTEVATVSLSGTAALTLTGLVTELASITETATAGLTVTSVVTQIATVIETADTSLTVTATAGAANSVVLTAVSGLVVTAAVTEVATITMVGDTTLAVTAAVTELAVVVLTATSGMVVTPVVVTGAAVTMAALAGLSATGVVVGANGLLLAADTSLTVATSLTVVAAVLLVALSQMVLLGGIQPTGMLFPVISPLPVSEGQLWPARYHGA